MYEFMTHTVISAGFTLIIMCDVYILAKGIMTIVKWVRKKISNKNG